MAFWKKWFGQSSRKEAAAQAEADAAAAASAAQATAQAAALKKQQDLLEEQKQRMEELEAENYKNVASRRRAIARGGGANLLSPERPAQTTLGVSGMLGTGASVR